MERFHSILRLALILIAAAVIQHPAAARDLGVIERQVDARSISVHISCSSMELRSLAERAFQAHGRFRIESASERAAYRLSFQGAGTQVAVQVLGPGGSNFGETVTGQSPRHALLLACDRAVSSITREPGFFSGRLTFTLERGGRKEVCVSDLFMGEFVQVTTDNSTAVTPKWAPDGQRLLYTSYFRAGYPDIYLIDLSSRRRVPFVSLKGTNVAARFSPDGRSVAMSLSGEGNPEIYVGNAQGRQLRRLTRNSGVDTSPEWSPDGARLVFTSSLGGKPQLYVVSAAGGTPQRLPTNISGYCAEPSWNPVKPHLIAFTAGVGSGFQVAVYDMQSRQSRIVSRGAGDALEPVWTADGRHLIYTQRQPNRRQLMLVDTDPQATKAPYALTRADAGMVAEADYIYRR